MQSHLLRALNLQFEVVLHLVDTTPLGFLFWRVIQSVFNESSCFHLRNSFVESLHLVCQNRSRFVLLCSVGTCVRNPCFYKLFLCSVRCRLGFPSLKVPIESRQKIVRLLLSNGSICRSAVVQLLQSVEPVHSSVRGVCLGVGRGRAGGRRRGGRGGVRRSRLAVHSIHARSKVFECKSRCTKLAAILQCSDVATRRARAMAAA